MKLCSKCKQTKSGHDFYKAYTARTKDNLAGWCKACTNAYNLERKNQYKGCLQRMLSDMRKRSKTRNKEVKFKFDEFILWAEQNGYSRLYSAWEAADKPLRLRPTVDRTNALKEYTFDNMSLKTYEDNISKGRTEITRKCKPITQMTKEGMWVANYPSASHASKITGISKTGINRVCNGIRITAGGYTWQFHCK